MIILPLLRATPGCHRIRPARSSVSTHQYERRSRTDGIAEDVITALPFAVRNRPQQQLHLQRPLDYAGAEILNQDIGDGDQPLRDFQPFGVSDIQTDALSC